MPFHKATYALLFGLLTGLIGCDGEKPEDNAGEQELITTVVLTLTDAANPASAVSATWRDLDGDGPGQPTIETLGLKAGTTYHGRIAGLLDETRTPAEDLAAEVRDEAEEHQFFFTPAGGIANRITVTLTDRESDYGPNEIGADLPVGLAFDLVVSAGAAADGVLNVVLSHYDEGPKTGQRSLETDIDIDVPVTITLP